MTSAAASRFICSQREMWIDLGNLESKLLRKKLNASPVDAPVYISGLARSGTTIMLELLAGLDGVVTHTYRDFPLLLTPFALRRFYRFLDRFAVGELKKTERAHKDRILVTPTSPESMEEVIWMSFFKKLHDESQNNVLNENTSLPAFERFYTDHIGKLLLAEHATRYVSKANYNVTRIRYLKKLFPSACFVLVIRNPLQHIASLMKQEKLFTQTQEEDPATLAHTEMTGHFEFGKGRRFIHTGDEDAMRTLQAAFAEGKDMLGWAIYWNSIYAYLLGLLGDPLLRDKLMVVHYEELCQDAATVLKKVFAFCALPCSMPTLNALAEEISAPDYYKPDFDEATTRLIQKTTEKTYRAYDQFRLLK